MMTATVFRLSSGLLPAVCAILTTGWFAQVATAQSLPPGAYQIAQALSPEERAKRRAARKKRREERAAGNGERRRGDRQRRGNARNARPAPPAQPAAQPARPPRRAARPAPPAAQPPRRARRAAPRTRPPAAVARRAPAAVPRKKRRRSPLRKLERNVRKLVKRGLRAERRARDRRDFERREATRRRADFRRRDVEPRRFRELRRAPERRRYVAPIPRERFERRDYERRDRGERRRRIARRNYNRDVRRYARSRRHVVRTRRYRNRFHRGRSIYYLPPAGVALAASLYALDSSRASYDDYYDTFMAPPVRRLPRHYTLNDIVTDPEVRGAVRSVNIDIITFASGSARIPPSQLYKLEDLADAIHATLRRRPDEVFLIAGHTDAVGPFDENLYLSQSRAAAVLEALVETFDVPEENLESVGYGEQYLRIDTDGPDRRNRRVVVRAIGALLARR